MPQFQLANFVPQMAWLVLAFAVLYFGIVRATLPRLARTIDAREGQMNGNLEAARSAKAAADELEAQHEAALVAARERARSSITDARAAAAKAQEGQLAQAAHVLADEGHAAAAAVATARDKALADIETFAADAAGAIVAKLTGHPAARGDVEAAVRNAMRVAA